MLLGGGEADAATGELIELAGVKLPREVGKIIFSYLDCKDLRQLSTLSKTIHNICKGILQKRSMEGDSNEALNAATGLPNLSELISPTVAPPAAIATTLTAVTTVMINGEETFQVPVNSCIILPVLPETMSMVATIPEVVTEKPVQGENTEVKISQVLPGYAPSYASDYIPSQISSHTYNQFVNTISFNVSRYPTLADVVSSKDYQKQQKKKEDEEKKKALASPQIPFTIPNTVKMDYMPAEYLSGPDTNTPTGKGVQSTCISMVKPAVLSSGRILTNMTTIPNLRDQPGTDDQGSDTGVPTKSGAS